VYIIYNNKKERKKERKKGRNKEIYIYTVNIHWSSAAHIPDVGKGGLETH